MSPRTERERDAWERDIPGEQRLVAQAALAGCRIWFDGSYWRTGEMRHEGSYTPARAAVKWMCEKELITRDELHKLLNSDVCGPLCVISPKELGWHLDETRPDP